MDENITFDEQARHYLGSLFDDDANGLRKGAARVMALTFEECALLTTPLNSKF